MQKIARFTDDNCCNIMFCAYGPLILMIIDFVDMYILYMFFLFDTSSQTVSGHTKEHVGLWVPLTQLDTQGTAVLLQHAL